jgi:hypothetical protein
MQLQSTTVMAFLAMSLFAHAAPNPNAHANAVAMPETESMAFAISEVEADSGADGEVDPISDAVVGNCKPGKVLNFTKGKSNQVWPSICFRR